MGSLLQNGRQQFIDQNGRPLVGGQVFFYAPNTETPADTWQDQGLTTPNTNPVVLDSRGQATIWGNATYRQIVQDRSGNTIWDQIVSALISLDDLSSVMPTVTSMANLRLVDKTKTQSVSLASYYGDLAGGGGVFDQDTSGAVALDDGGIVIVADDGGVWRRRYDGVNVQAAWFGITVNTADIGPYFAKFPTNCFVWFGPGSFTVLTYPTEAQFKNRFYRGINTIFRCNGSLAGTSSTDDLLPAFTWSFEPSVQATDSNGGNIGDMMIAGLSPIEGIGIIGNSQTQGIGFAMGNSGTNVYFIRPKNFSVQNFGVGFQYLRTMDNCFLTGLENVTLKSNGTNLICDNTNVQTPTNPGGINSGENFLFKSCYIGGATVVGANVVKAQLATFDNCSFDYNTKMGIFNNSNVKLKNCYIEGTPASTASNRTPANWFDVLGVSTLDVDSSTNIYMLGGTFADMNGYDFFNVNVNGFGNPNVRCNASIFSSPQRYKPLSSFTALNVFGSTMRCNGGAYPTIVSESANLFPDARLSADMSLYPSSSNTTIGTVGSPAQPISGSTKAIRMLPPSTTTGATWVLPKTKVKPGQELYVQFLDLTDATLQQKHLAIRYYTADGVLIPATTFMGGQFSVVVPANSAYLIWEPRIYAHQVPMGADYAVITCSVDPRAASGDSGSWFVGTVYVWQ